MDKGRSLFSSDTMSFPKSANFEDIVDYQDGSAVLLENPRIWIVAMSLYSNCPTRLCHPEFCWLIDPRVFFEIVLEIQLVALSSKNRPTHIVLRWDLTIPNPKESSELSVDKFNESTKSSKKREWCSGICLILSGFDRAQEQPWRGVRAWCYVGKNAGAIIGQPERHQMRVLEGIWILSWFHFKESFSTEKRQWCFLSVIHIGPGTEYTVMWLRSTLWKVMAEFLKLSTFWLGRKYDEGKCILREK